MTTTLPNNVYYIEVIDNDNNHHFYGTRHGGPFSRKSNATSSLRHSRRFRYFPNRVVRTYKLELVNE